jgi:hypothetical protein
MLQRARHGRPVVTVVARGRRGRTSSTTRSSPTAWALGFVTETAAYDLCALCEWRATRRACHDRLLAIFLDIDKEAETTAEERALRGVRKAQAKLATFYLLRGHAAHARAHLRGHGHESPERLRSIRDEMLAITSKQFWEVADRGTNFDYIDDARKEKLREFFAQFDALSKLPPRTKGGTGPTASREP